MMMKCSLLIIASLCGVAADLNSVSPQCPSRKVYQKLRSTTNEMRKAAAARQSDQEKNTQMKPNFPPPPLGTPDYFHMPNYANSPLPTIQNTSVVTNTGMRKFVDSLPGLGYDNRNNLGQYIPVAVADTSSYPNSDYYEISVSEYIRQMHSDLPLMTTLRGYKQTNTTDPNINTNQYLGPMIVAQKDRPVRILFTNALPTTSVSEFFLPVDSTIMGAGLGPDMTHSYTSNRAELHLHGGNTPWISDGTPHQWITPATEGATYPSGVALQQVPDMDNPSPVSGQATYYYPNQQSARLMFAHDHSYGITRLNVYAGEALPYLLIDSVETQMITDGILPNAGGVYQYGIPLVIQDKSFVPPETQLQAEDPTWPANLRTVGSLWLPHVYMPNQNLADSMGVNAMGRWDYGPWFWPPVTAAAGLKHGPVLFGGVLIPGTPNPSLVPEAFMDTPVVNGCAYPYLTVDRKPYRFRILNACNDRHLNLQLYYAEPISISVVDGGSGYTKAPRVIIKGKAKKSAKAKATVANGKVVEVKIQNYGSGYKNPPTIKFSGGGKHAKGAKAIASLNTEVKMVPASPTGNFPAYYPTPDGRDGGFPDPANSGPSMIQVGTEGGFLPSPVVLPNTPIGYDYNRRVATTLNVLEKTLLMGPAERADVIIDFSVVPKNVKYLILYNDAPAPMPLYDSRYDYFTNDPDQTVYGGAPSTIVGYGPNTRTILQFRLTNTKGHAFNLQQLQNALPIAYVDSQSAPVVPETTYPPEYRSANNTYSGIQDNTLTFTPVGASSPITQGMLPKALIEDFELNYGRMNGILGIELPFTNGGNQTSILQAYIDPPTENIYASDPLTPIANMETQLWKITHNGVDTHAIHFHLFNVQLVNRVGWDGMIKPPDSNELGWKETVRMNPLEDVIVALRPIKQTLPFSIGTSARLLDPTMNNGDTWTSFDPLTGQNITVTNQEANFGDEYVWHCHLLGHEENDMMRPIAINLAPTRPTNVSVVTGPGAGEVTFSFTAVAYTGPLGSPASIVYTISSVPSVFGNINPTTPSGSATDPTLGPVSVTFGNENPGNTFTTGEAYTFYVTATATDSVTGQVATSQPSLIVGPLTPVPQP